MADFRPTRWTGLRVLELADEDGQLCGKYFAEAGADVIKVEPPLGQRFADRDRFAGDEPDPNRGRNYWQHLRHKRSLSLNLETPLGRHVFHQICSTADVLIEALSPGYLASLGCGFPDLLPLNPGLILISITPFGQVGPEAEDWPSDPLGRLLAGCSAARPSYGTDCPAALQGFGALAWQRAARWAYLQAGAALRRRAATGRGEHLDISLQEALVVGDLCHGRWTEVQPPGADSVALDGLTANHGRDTGLPARRAGLNHRPTPPVGIPALWPSLGRVPERGEHTREILVGELGYSLAEIADLAAASVI